MHTRTFSQLCAAALALALVTGCASAPRGASDAASASSVRWKLDDTTGEYNPVFANRADGRPEL